MGVRGLQVGGGERACNLKMDRYGLLIPELSLIPIDNLAQEPRFSYLYNGIVVTSEVCWLCCKVHSLFTGT